ncbi:MAG: NADPH-dependent F420 reductase [Anaerolineales bacterium]|jgi:NADPH-dependent F420 reductase
MTDRLILTVAVLGGTGNLGPGLALRWSRAGYKVLIGSRKAEKGQRVAAELNQILDVNAITGLANQEAAREADISVLTVNHTAHRSALKSLKPALKGKILVDTTARIDFRDPKPPEPPSAARIAQDLLGPEVAVAAAFQTIPASVLRKNLDDPLDLDVFVFSDKAQAAEEAIRLAEGGGMRAFNAGGLENAIVAEGLVAMLLSMNKRYRSKTGTLRVAGITK